MKCTYCGETSFTELGQDKVVCDSCGAGFNVISRTPSQQAKSHGCRSLQHVANVTKQSVQTLINWHRDKPELFAVVCVGVAESTKGGA